LTKKVKADLILKKEKDLFEKLASIVLSSDLISSKWKI